MRFSGELEQGGLAKVLREIHEQKWSGNLHLHAQDGVHAYLLFANGRILTCYKDYGATHATLRHDTLADELIDLELLDVSQVQEALALSQARDLRLEKALLQLNFLSE